MDHFTRVQFSHFKAFKQFSANLKQFNILVGPNNAGKSTILVAFRILAAGLRRAAARKSSLVLGPNGKVPGYEVDLGAISVAEENIFYNYDASQPASVAFHLANKNTLTLWFPEQGVCNLIPDAGGARELSPKTFSKHFDCGIGFVPILGPVEHHEPLYEREAARLALFNYRASRNFRNIWHHYPEKFDEFREALRQTWPGMDIEQPEIDLSHGKPRLHMYCPEDRIPRELFWSGFGFQVWCQMLTHIIQADRCSIFLIDEPDIYLHSDLQRQLLGILRNLGPDVLLATHSTEIIAEAEADELVIINKNRRSAKRITDPAQLESLFVLLGSNLNPTLTQLAKTRRVLFVEGKDFQILGRFARKLGALDVGNRSSFAVVPVEGFSPERIRTLRTGMETTLGSKIVAAAILDRDFRSAEECAAIYSDCMEFCDFVVIHQRKEVENFLLVPSAIERAAVLRIAERQRRSSKEPSSNAPNIANPLNAFCDKQKHYVQAQLLAERRKFDRIKSPGVHETNSSEAILAEFDAKWNRPEQRFKMIPGKDALSAVNLDLQTSHAVNVTPRNIIDAMKAEEIDPEMRALVETLVQFAKKPPP